MKPVRKEQEETAMERPAVALQLRFSNGTLITTTFSEICRLRSWKLRGCDLPPNLWGESPDLSPLTASHMDI